MKDDAFLTTLHEGDTIAVLLLLLERGDGVIMKDLAGVIPNYATRRARVDAMEEEGLVDVETTYSPQKFTHVRLTDRGRSVASSLATVNVFVAPGKADVLEKSICMKYAEPLLRLLRPSMELKQSEVLKTLPNYRTVVRTVAALEADGLLTVTPTETGYRTNVIRLTPLGKQVADVFEIVHRQITG